MMKRMMFLAVLGVAVFLSSTAHAHFWDGKSEGKECSMKMGKEHCQCRSRISS